VDNGTRQLELVSQNGFDVKSQLIGVLENQFQSTELLNPAAVFTGPDDVMGGTDAMAYDTRHAEV
jgi:hypothetical protein